MGWLGSIGSIAGGVSQGIQPYLQDFLKQQNQNVQDKAAGDGIYAMMGVSAPPQQQGGLGSLLGGAPNVPVPQPQMTQPGQGGVAQSPMPQPANIPTLPKGAPMNPSAGQTLPGAPQAQQPQAPPQQVAQQSPQLQQQQGQPAKGPDLSHFDGQFDFNHLMHNLTQQPGMTAQKLGMIARSPAFERMLIQQGLNQYRSLGLGLRQEGYDIKENEFKTRESDINKRQQNSEATRANITAAQATFTAVNKDAQSRIAQINAGVMSGAIKPEDAAKQIQAINDDREKKIADGIAKMNAFKPGGEEADSSGGSDDVIHDPKTGKMYRYKGKGDRGDINSYSPVQ